MTNSTGIDRILDRARKLSALAQHSDNEAEAAGAASRLRKIMEEYQLSEAMLRIEDTDRRAEAILTDARLEPDADRSHRKRVAWKETISSAVARDVGVHEFFRWSTYWHNGRQHRCADVRGVGRETAIQTWQYTCQYLWRAVDDLADRAWDSSGKYDGGSPRAWKNSFRLGCASKISERIISNRRSERRAAEDARRAAFATDVPSIFEGGTPSVAPQPAECLALALVQSDQEEVDEAYNELKRGFSARTAGRIGSSSGDGYGAGREAGGSVALGGARAGLAAGQGRIGGGK